MSSQETIDILGPLGALYADDTVAEIMVDGHDRVYVERQSVLEDVPSPFTDNAQLIALVAALTAAQGRPASDAQPVVDFRLPDGSRANAVLPPVSLTGPTLVIRKFPARRLTIEDLLGFGSWSESIVTFLRACVQARLNIVITGNTSSGKTTVLSLVAGMAPPDERLIVVENATELRLPQRRVVRLESRPPDPEGRGAVSLRQLVANATHMRPDRIILGEATGPEALDLIQAMNNGFDGSLCSLHATSPRDALIRLETLGLMAAPELPVLTLRQQIADAVHLITYQELMPDKKRRMTKIAEVTGFEGQAITLADIFEFRPTGFQEGRVTGTYTATGHIPRTLGRLRDAGLDLPLDTFTLA